MEVAENGAQMSSADSQEGQRIALFDEGEANGTCRIVPVGIHEDNGLPRPEHELATHHWHDDRWRYPGWENMVSSVAGRTMSVPVQRIIWWQEPIDGVNEVIV
jgi:hypothetical protein